MPYQEAVAGELATAAYVNEYFMDQAVVRFTSAAQRDAQLLTPVIGQTCVLTDTQVYQFYNGTGWTDILYVADDQGWRTWTPTMYADSTAFPTSQIDANGWYKKNGVMWDVIIEVTVLVNFGAGPENLLFGTPPGITVSTVNFGGFGFFRNGSASTDFFDLIPRYVNTNRVGAWYLDWTVSGDPRRAWGLGLPALDRPVAGDTIRMQYTVRP